MVSPTIVPTVLRPSGEWVGMRSTGRPRATEAEAPGAWQRGAANARRLARRVRNDRLADWWSASHFAWGAALTVFVGPFWAFGLMVAWEPFEILLLGPLLSRKGIAFGHETWRNSVSDIVFDGAGVAAACVLLLAWDPLGTL
jgi:hypothetical protein